MAAILRKQLFHFVLRLWAIKMEALDGVAI